MKKITTLIIIIVALICNNKTQAQTYTLDLGSSFSPAWTAGGTSGTASNIGGSGINCTVNFALTGSGSIASSYPQVNNNNSNSGIFVVQNSTDAMELDINLGNKTSYVTVTYTFSAPVQNVSFGISDIDVPSANSPFTYVDQVKVTGAGPAGTIIPSLTKYNTSSTVFTILGNIATGDTTGAGSNVSSLSMGIPIQDGTMFVSFSGNAVKSITVQYNSLNSTKVNTNPALQAIALGNISFSKAIAPVTTNVTATTMSSTNAKTAIPSLAGTDDESVVSYTIATLPSVASGVLYYNNGTGDVAVAAGQVFTTAQAATLKFDPALAFSGNAMFTYTATDNRGLVSNTSNYTVPVTFASLPVILTNFSAVWSNNSVILSWTTEQELNSSKFIIDKSSDGINWQAFASVAAAGNSSLPVNYTSADAQPYAITYYRLKQVDLDGAYVYSKVLRMIKENNNFSIKVFPNPGTSIATITTTSKENKSVHIKVYSNNGMLVNEMTRQITTGTNNIDIPSVGSLAIGMYTVTIDDSGNNQPGVARFIKQ
jgi:hypothetical protein